MADANPFALLFQKGDDLPVAPYLTFLHMDGDSVIGLARIEHALKAENAGEHRLRLFNEVNWRLHLVAAVALLMDGGRDEDLTAMWWAIDRGSWVSPQLVVTAFYCDPDFPNAARTRIEGHCLLLGDVWGKKDHPTYSGKTLAAILRLASDVPDLRDWAEAKAHDAAIVEVIKSAVDDGRAIATNWKANAEAVFAKQGKPLVPRLCSTLEP